MTPDTQQARDGYPRPPVTGRNAATATRSGAPAADAARPPHRAAHPAHPAHAAHAAHAAPPATAQTARSREDASIVGVIPLVAVLVVATAGVYIAWRQGSAGAGEGGVIGGAALLAGAVVRLVLPARLAGLLATRKRATDVLTLAVFGAGLLAAGLVLPR
jgi:Protein of unknown function (DUF3017)